MGAPTSTGRRTPPNRKTYLQVAFTPTYSKAYNSYTSALSAGVDDCKDQMLASVEVVL